MTYYITALSNNKARLIHSQTTTDSETIRDMVVGTYLAAGFIPHVREERG